MAAGSRGGSVLDVPEVVETPADLRVELRGGAVRRGGREARAPAREPRAQLGRALRLRGAQVTRLPRVRVERVELLASVGALHVLVGRGPQGAEAPVVDPPVEVRVAA